MIQVEVSQEQFLGGPWMPWQLVGSGMHSEPERCYPIGASGAVACVGNRAEGSRRQTPNAYREELPKCAP